MMFINLVIFTLLSIIWRYDNGLDAFVKTLFIMWAIRHACVLFDVDVPALLIRLS